MGMQMNIKNDEAYALAIEIAGIEGVSLTQAVLEALRARKRELTKADKLARVVGLASSVLYDNKDPYNPINRRMSITIMNRAAEDAAVDSQGPSNDRTIAGNTGSVVPNADAPAPGAVPAQTAAPSEATSQGAASDKAAAEKPTAEPKGTKPRVASAP